MTKPLKASASLNSAESRPLFRYVLNPYVETEKTREKPAGKRLTVPDQSLTIKQILERHTRGLRVPDQMVGYYDDENDPLDLQGTNIETLDLSEKYDILSRIRQQNADLRSRYKREQDAQKLSNLKQQIAKEISEQQKADQPNTP